MIKRSSDKIKLQYCCAGSGARLMDSRDMRNIMNMRVLQNDKVKILRDASIKAETKIDHN